MSEIIAPSGEILRVSANGGVPVVAVPFDSAAGEVRQRRPLVLRESRMVLYVGTTRNDTSALVMYSLRDRRHVRFAVSGTPLAVIGGLLVYASGGALSAVAIDVPGMRLTGGPVRLSQRAAPKQTGTAVAVSEAGTLVYEDGPRGLQLGRGAAARVARRRAEVTAVTITFRGGPVRGADERLLDASTFGGSP